MKKHALLPGRAATLRTGFRTGLAALLLLFGTGLTSCEKEHNCKPATQPVSSCSTFATVETDECRGGFLGGTWFRLDNGDLLLPKGSSVTVPNLTQGQRIRLGFTTLQNNPKATFSCNYFQAPEEPDLGIQITCIEPIGFCGTPNGSACNVFVTAENVMCGNGVWRNTWLKLDDGTYLQPWETSANVVQVTPGQRYRIGFEKVARDSRYNQFVTCQAVPPPATAVRITCLAPDSATVPTITK